MSDRCFSCGSRRKWLIASSLAWTALCCAAVTATPASQLRRTAIVKAVQQARPSVVNIHGHKTVASSHTERGFHDGLRRVNGMGTGVVIDERGYIVTNHHVVDGVRQIQVTTADERTVIGRLIAHDPKTDLAILKIPVDEEMPVIKTGTSQDLMPGEPVIAVGNAYGYEHTVTRGIISALHRTVQVSDSQEYTDLIQTDAAINPGNSGGPLLNIDGEMIGVNVAVRVGAQGIGFALPVDQVLDVASRLICVRRLEDRWHGVCGDTSVSDRGPRFVVSSVEVGSPAASSGLKPDDVVTSVGRTKIERALDFELALLGRDLDDKLQLAVRRDGRPMTMTMVLAPLPRRQDSTAGRAWMVLGLKLEPVATGQIRQVSTRYRGGLRVVGVRPDSPAAAQGIRRGDILVGMHVWETISLDNLAYVMDREDFADFQPVKFYILRGNETLYGYLLVELNK